MKHQQINWSDIDQHLSSDDWNDLAINYKDLIRLINNGELILTTTQGKRISLNFQTDVPEKTAWLDSGFYNFGENTIDVIL